MKKTELRGKLVGILLIVLIITSAFSGAVSAGNSVVSNNPDPGNKTHVIPEENYCDESTPRNTITANLSLSKRINEILEEGKLPFLFFYADWCGFCKKQKPIIEELKEEYADSVEFIWLNAEENREEAQQFGVSGYPTMFFIFGKDDNGYLYKRFGGYTERDELAEAFDGVIETGTADNGMVISFDERLKNNLGGSLPENLSDLDHYVRQVDSTYEGFSDANSQIIDVVKGNKTKKFGILKLSQIVNTHQEPKVSAMVQKSVYGDIDGIIILIPSDDDDLLLNSFGAFKPNLESNESEDTQYIKWRASQYAQLIKSASQEIKADNPDLNVVMCAGDVYKLTDGLEFYTIQNETVIPTKEYDFMMDLRKDIVDSLDYVLIEYDKKLTVVPCEVITIAGFLTMVFTAWITTVLVDYFFDTIEYCIGWEIPIIHEVVSLVVSIVTSGMKPIIEKIAVGTAGFLGAYASGGSGFEEFYDDCTLLIAKELLNSEVSPDDVEAVLCEYCKLESFEYNTCLICMAWKVCIGPRVEDMLGELVKEMNERLEKLWSDALPQLEISWAIDNYVLNVGETATVTYSLFNNPEVRHGHAYNLHIEDTIPPEFDLISGSPAHTFDLSPGERKTISYTIKATTEGSYILHRCPIRYIVKFVYEDKEYSDWLCWDWATPDITLSVTPNSCTDSTDCLGCQKCEANKCVPDDSDPNEKCSGTCCGGVCYTEAGICCDGTYFKGSNACCDGTDCGPDEECIDHKCLKLNNIPCFTSSECKSGNCAGCFAEKRCCPEGMKWDGSKCVYGCDAPVSCPDTCNPSNQQYRWYDGQPYVPNGYDNDGDGIKEASCPLNHNKVMDVNGDGIYDCCYLQEECPEGTSCSAGVCISGETQTCTQAGYQCCDACLAGTEHPEYTDCSPKVCCEECLFTGCNPYCPDPTDCDIITSKVYSDCCNPNDPNCEYVVKLYTSAGWQMCGYHNSESCCAGWKEDNYCSEWQDDECGGGNCPLGLMHQTRDCWGPAEGDCPESRCVERSKCEELVIGDSYARLYKYTINPCTDENTVDSSCSHSNLFYLETNGEIGNRIAQGDMVAGIDDNIIYCESEDNSAFRYWEPLSDGSEENEIEVRHKENFTCPSGYVPYGECCYRYRCNSRRTDCAVTIKCPAIEMNNPSLKAPLTREQYYDFEVYPHIIWFAASAGQDSYSCEQLRNEVKSYLLDPCEVTINGETYYSYPCLQSRCSYGSCMDEKHGGYTLDYEPFFFYEEIAEITKPDLVPHSVNMNGPVIETQNAFIEVVIKNKLNIFGSGVDTDAGFYVDVYVDDTFIGRKAQYGLQNGSSVKLCYVWENATVGLHELKAHVDSTNSVDEREEGNNWITKIVEVQPKTDIVVNNLNIDASIAKSGDTVPIIVTLHNTGSSDTNEFVTTLSVDGIPEAYNITSLTAGESQEISFNWTAILGEHNLTITADSLPVPDGVIPETNELNNKVSKTVNISLKGTTAPILSFTFEPGYFFDGVEPDTGNKSTIFEYRIKYIDYDNDPPASGHPKLWLDINGDGDYDDVIGGFAEGNFTMNEVNSLDSTYTDGKLYFYNTTLPSSENITYKFEAFDETGRNATGDTGVNNGPYVYSEAENKLPIANFSYSPVNPVVNETITFNASPSYDPDGYITKYEWDFGDGTNATGKIVTHSYSANGTYEVTLIVTDNNEKI